MIGNATRRKQFSSNGKGLLGYRGWYLIEHLIKPNLQSLTFVEKWDGQPKTARCYMESVGGGWCSESPGSGCMCGYWMVETPEELSLHTDSYHLNTNGSHLQAEVAGLVQAWGRCIWHANGIRCEHMRIVALLGKAGVQIANGRVGSASVRDIVSIGLRYDVPVLSTLEELVKFKKDWEGS